MKAVEDELMSWEELAEELNLSIDQKVKLATFKEQWTKEYETAVTEMYEQAYEAVEQAYEAVEAERNKTKESHVQYGTKSGMTKEELQALFDSCVNNYTFDDHKYYDAITAKNGGWFTYCTEDSSETYDEAVIKYLQKLGFAVYDDPYSVECSAQVGWVVFPPVQHEPTQEELQGLFGTIGS